MDNNNVETIEKTKKGNMKVLVYVLSSVIVILAGLLIYFVFIKDTSKENTKNNDANKPINKVDNNNNNVDNNTKNDNTKDDNTKNDNGNVDKPKEDNNSKSGAVSDDVIIDLIKKIKKYELLTLRNSDKKVTFNSNDITYDMLNALFDYVTGIDNSYSEHFENETTWSFSQSTADSYFKTVFGFVPKEYSSLICPNDDEALLVYDKAEKKFTFNDEHPGHGAPASGFIDYKVVDSKKSGNIYSIDVYFLRGNIADGWYINDKDFWPNSLDDLEEVTDNDLKKEFAKLEDFSSYSMYTFEFEKVNNDYILKSITPKN